ncbi:hypothetical protein FORMB_26520 [Formosa sp. Hel1_33_131]|nr:hypothetical protein FORMB_26520 [Formosa sp. Hel1_33_131]
MIFFPESFFAGILTKINDFCSNLEFFEFLLWMLSKSDDVN